ncbi:MAG TPA: type VI secretion system baseplate subunit TssK [Victivallales bacterium]|nr:type VI secretion system baseplate subunit TssK [Victivallales bacterium]
MLSAVKWYVGQPLMPDNWHLMNDSLVEYTFDLVNFSCSNMFGVSKLDIDLNMLDFQILRLKSLQLILPTGEYFDLNINSKCNNLDLSEISNNRTDVYINVNTAPPVNYNYRGSDIKTQYYSLELSETSNPQADFTFKLCRLNKSLDDKWELDYTFVPCSFNLNNIVGKNLLRELTLLADRIINYYNSLIDTSETLIAKKIEFRPCIEVAYEIKRICALDNSCLSEQRPHNIFTIIYQLYVKTALFFLLEPKSNFKYNHYDIYTSLTFIRKDIESLLATNYYNYELMKFKNNGILHEVQDIPEHYLNLEKLYLAVQLPTQDFAFDENSIIIASSSRYQIVHTQALYGLRTQRINKIPLSNNFTGCCLFFKFLPGKEWDFIVKEYSIFMTSLERHKNINFYLCYVK